MTAMLATSFFRGQTVPYRPKSVSTAGGDLIYYVREKSESTSVLVISYATVPTPVDVLPYPKMIVATTAFTHDEKPRILHLERLSFADKVLTIHSGLSLEVKVYFEDSNWIAFSEHFGIYGFGPDPKDALRDFQQSFIEFYENIVNCPDEILGPTTIEYKKVLSSFANIA